MALQDPDFLSDPYPTYAEMRTQLEPVWLAHEQATSSEGVWLFSRYDDALRIFKESAAISKNLLSVRTPKSKTPFDLHMLHRDGEDHLRLRRLVANYFSAQSLANFEPQITSIVQELIDEIRHKGQVDLIEEFAEKVPLRVIAKLMGIPNAHMEKVREWSLLLGNGFDSVISNQDIQIKAASAMQEFLEFIDQLTRVDDFDDNSLLAQLLFAHEQGQLNKEELTAMIGFLLFAGHETTISLLGNGLWLLLSHPEQWQALKNEPTLLPGTVEEILRYESPEQRTSFRITKETVDINGTRLHPGQQLGVVIGAANRDENFIPQADVFDIRRKNNRHVAFGIGAHNCLGKTLARVEARIAFGMLVKQIPEISLVSVQADWRENSFFRSLKSLPVVLP